jgi:hypothetical protein
MFTPDRLTLIVRNRIVRRAAPFGSYGPGWGQDMTSGKTAKIELENVNVPGYVKRVDAHMYQAVKQAFLKVLPKKSPGLTQVEILQRLVAHLPERLFPGGAKAGWWAKTVQLDLEAKGIVAREKTKPLRWHKDA